MPGLSNWLNNLIVDSIAWVMVNPTKLTLDIDQLVNGTYTTFDKAVAILKLDIHQATSLPKVDTMGSCDPYVRFEVNGKILGKTKTVPDSLEPFWNETHYLLVTSLKDPIILRIMDFNNLKKDKSVGYVSIDLNNVDKEDSWTTIKLDVNSRSKDAQLNYDATLYYVDKKAAAIRTEEASSTKEAEETESPKEEMPSSAVEEMNDEENEIDEICTGVLCVTIHQAKDLVGSAVGKNKIYNPFVECSLYKFHIPPFEEYSNDVGSGFGNYYRSKTKKRNNSPTYEESFELFISDINTQMLHFIVRDDKDLIGGYGFIGDISIPVSEVIQKGVTQKDWYTLKHCDSGKVRVNFSFTPVNVDIINTIDAGGKFSKYLDAR
jgi:Ca2+-dependent lipid-binding protein